MNYSQRSIHFGTCSLFLLILTILAGCDFHVIAPWERGGAQPQPPSQPPPQIAGEPDPTEAPPPLRPVRVPSPQKAPEQTSQRTSQHPPQPSGSCQRPKDPPTEITLNKEKWKSGMKVFFDEPSKNTDGSSLKGLESLLVYYHIIQRGNMGDPMLVTTIKATSKEGGEQNGGKISFSDLKKLQRYLRARQDVQTVFCSRAVNSAGPGKMSPPIGIQFRRGPGWVPPRP